MALQKTPYNIFIEALERASAAGRVMSIRQIRYDNRPDGQREPVIGPWCRLTYIKGHLTWTDVTFSPFGMDQSRSVTLSRNLFYRLDTFTGKADIKDGKRLYLQIKIEIPDAL